MTEEELMKQAKESWWNDDTCSGGMTTEKIYERGFVAGHKSGYQEGLKAKINATTISDCPIKDEWHYPSKGELPKEHRKRYLIATPGLIVGAETRTNLGKDIVFVNDFGTFERASEVIAWRELPELPKEEE